MKIWNIMFICLSFWILVGVIVVQHMIINQLNYSNNVLSATAKFWFEQVSK